MNTQCTETQATINYSRKSESTVLQFH